MRPFVLLIALTVAVPAASSQTAPATDVLRGAIDIHVHALPDSRPRSLDVIEAARFARDRGMRAIVLKNHYEPTASLAYVARTAVPGIEVFGGIGLNLSVGGINPAAVEHMTRVTGGYGRIVWMPTFDAENAVRFADDRRPFVSVSGNGGVPLPAVKDVIALVAKHNLVLATGHSSPEEVLMLLREGRRQGVRHMVVTHAMNPPILMDVRQMQEAAKLGAFIEFVGSSLETPEAPARMDRFAEAIRQIGPQFTILSSDLGQKDNPLPAEGYAAFLAAMRARGFSEADVDLMSKRNPALLLGLP